MRNTKILMVFILIIFTVVQVSALKINIVTEHYPPYNYEEDGKITGPSTEIIEEIMKRAGFEYEIKVFPWARAYKEAQNKENTLIYSIGRNEEREDLFQWGKPIVDYDIYFYKMKARDDIQLSTIKDIGKYKIGVVRDDFRTQELQAKGFSDNLKIGNNDTFNTKKLYGGRIDLVPLTELNAVWLAKMNGLDPSKLEKTISLIETDLYFAFSKNTDQEIVNKCKNAFNSMVKDGTHKKILKPYLK